MNDLESSPRNKQLGGFVPAKNAHPQCLSLCKNALRNTIQDHRPEKIGRPKTSPYQSLPLEALGLKQQERVNGAMIISRRGREKTRREIRHRWSSSRNGCTASLVTLLQVHQVSRFLVN